MLDAARPLTLVDELLPLRGAPKAIADWVRGLGGAGRLVVIGRDAMPFDFHRDIADALAPAGAIDITPRLAALMRRKSARELAAIRGSCATLDAAVAALETAWRSGAAVTTAILAAEQAAYRAAAQDVRTLFSLDNGHTLAPFTVPDARRVEPLQVYVAVRQHGYWAEGFVAFSILPSGAQIAAGTRLRAGIAAVRPGLPRHLLNEMLAMQPVHLAVAQSSVSDIGLSLETGRPESPGGELLAPDSTYSLRVGIRQPGEAAIASAMIAVTASGADVLWVKT
jgi:hypothetical protein